MRLPAEALEERLGYSFSDRPLLLRALTHRSWLAERMSPSPEEGDNEQLEFLGDSILGFLVSEAVVARYPLEQEGRLSELKAHLVSAQYLHKCAVEIGLGNFLQLGRGEEQNGGRERKTLLANAFEAVIAAMYLDGGLGEARRFVEKQIVSGLAQIEADDLGGLRNFKSRLQERAQAAGFPFPKYITIGASGPEHARLFTVEARITDRLTSKGTASSKKAASQLAAESLYEKLGKELEGAAVGEGRAHKNG